MKKKLIAVAFLASGLTFGQVGIGTNTPNSSLDIISKNGATDKDGILIPRITKDDLAKKTAGTYAASQHGAMVFITNATAPTGTNPSLNQTNNIIGRGFYYFKWDATTSSGTWVSLTSDADLRFVGTNNHTTQDAGIDGNGTSLGNGSNNIAIGKNSLQSNTSANELIGIGSNALNSFNYQSDNTDGIIGIGVNALKNYNPASGNEPNLAIGKNSLTENTTGYGNHAVGYNALSKQTVGNFNTALGYGALQNNERGSFNTAFGNKSLNSLIENYQGNTAFGYRTAMELKKGNDNTYIGSNTAVFLVNTETYSDNTFIGANVTTSTSLTPQTQIIYNRTTALGSSSLKNLPETTKRIYSSSFLGYGTKVTGTQENYEFSTAIGSEAMVGASNSIVLGRVPGYPVNNTTQDKVGIGTVEPTNALHVKASSNPVKIEGLLSTTDSSNQLIALDAEGLVKKMDKSVIANNIYLNDGTIATNRIVSLSGTNNTLTFTRTGTVGASDIPVLATNGSVQTIALRLDSDARLKENIKPINGDLALKLNPVTYNWNKAGKDKGGNNLLQYGFIAQEVEKVMPDAVFTDKDGYKSVNYIEVIPVLAQKIKDQDELIKKLIDRVEKLESKTK